MSPIEFTDQDREQLAAREITADEAQRQIERLRRPPRYVELLRPCTVGDGIERIPEDEQPALIDAHTAAAAAGRFLKFVPASGAASRMFADLHYFHRGAGRDRSWSDVSRRAKDGGHRERTLEIFLKQIRRFAFHDDLRQLLQRGGISLDGLADAGAFAPILDALLDETGLGYDSMAKGLIRFHDDPGGARTAFEEHLVEAATYVRDASGRCRLHLTVSPEARPLFDRRLLAVEGSLSERYDARFEVGYSFQKPSTDTLALDSTNGPARDGSGRLRLRPGGHGSLIENLNELRADLIFVKNIDNVQPDRTKAVTATWKAVLAGRLLELQRYAFGSLDRLRDADPPVELLDEATALLAARMNIAEGFHDTPPSYQCRRAFLIDRLNRPVRVCGVVPATGEPGGGPFWVRLADGSTGAQIVESAQVDPADEKQQEIWRSSTHFNPVDLVCGVRDSTGEPFDLQRFVDRDAAIVTTKSEAGRTIRVLERPGLWNGAMAGWNTAFVEVPLCTFSPVKTVLDLLRAEHQSV